MTRNRLNMLIAVMAMAVVVLAGFFVGVQPQLAQAAADRDQQRSVDAANDTKAAELARLRERAKSLPKLQAELASLEASIPATASMSSFYASLDTVAGNTGVTVSAITTSDAVAYAPPAGATDGAADGGSDAGSGATSGGDTASASPSASATASATPSTPTTTTDPKITGSNFSAVPVSVSVDGSFDQALAFVGGVQSGARLFLINAITSTSSDAAGEDGAASTTWTFSGYVYVLTDSTSDTAADTASAAATDD